MQKVLRYFFAANSCALHLETASTRAPRVNRIVKLLAQNENNELKDGYGLYLGVAHVSIILLQASPATIHIVN